MEHLPKKPKRSESTRRRPSTPQTDTLADSINTQSDETERYNLRNRKIPLVSSSKASESSLQRQSVTPGSSSSTTSRPSGRSSQKRKQTEQATSSKRIRFTKRQSSRLAKKLMGKDDKAETAKTKRSTARTVSNKSSEEDLESESKSKANSQRQTRRAEESEDQDGNAKKKGKAKASKPDSSSSKKSSSKQKETKRKQIQQRKPKKQADPEELMDYNPDSDVEPSPVSYFDFFGNNDEELEEDEENEGRDHVDYDDAASENEEESWDRERYDEEEHYDEDDHEDMDDDEGEEELARVRRSLGLHLQGSFGGLMSDMTGRLRSILTSLKNDEPTMQLVALQELAEILSVSSEDNLAGYFASDSFVKELVRIMKGPNDLGAGGMDMSDDMMLALAMSEGLGGGNPELTLLACRCISNLLDAMPTAVTSLVYHGAIGVLCQKLKSIEYIDLAEQALSALEKIASHLPRAVVHEGGLSATLMYFDFFSIHSQRTALRTAANCMRGVDLDSYSQVQEILPTILNTVTYPDRTVVELTCLCWVRLAESYRSSREHLEKAVSVELLKKTMELIPLPGNVNSVRPGTFADILRLHRIAAKSSPKLGFELYKLKIIDTLYQVLTGTTTGSSDTAVTDVSIDSKWRDSIHAIMRIFVDVLPPIPKDGLFSSKRFKEDEPVSTRTRSSKAAEIVKDNTPEANESDPRIDHFAENADQLEHIGRTLIPLLLEIYTSTVNIRVRQLATHILVKIIHFSNPETLQHVLKEIPLSTFLAGVLAQQEHASLVIDALYQAEMLIQKIPEVYLFLFEREGVLHEIESIANASLTEENQNDDSKDQRQSSNDNNNDRSDTSATSALLRAMREARRLEESSDDDGSSRKTEESSNERSTNRQQDDKADDDDKSLSATMAARRRVLDRAELHKLLRHRLGGASPQASPDQQEKGLGRGSTRRYIIQLAQNFVREYRSMGMEEDFKKSGNALDEIRKISKKLAEAAGKDSVAESALNELKTYMQESIMGISSFELMNSGLMDALLQYLTNESGDTYVSSVDQRRAVFRKLFFQQMDQGKGISPIRTLVLRLQELLNRFEPFDVVTPLESSALGENFRNPTSMLAKQLRLRLTGQGPDIPIEYQHLMVSTHAVATFKVLEEYLLTRIGNTSCAPPMSKSGRSGETEDTDNDEAKDTAADDEADNMDLEDTEDEEHEMLEDSDGQVPEEDEEEMSSQSATRRSRNKKETKKQKKSYASALRGRSGKWRIKFYLKDTLVSNDTTVYGAVHQYEMQTNRSSSSIRNIWVMSYPVRYEKVWEPTDESQDSQEAPSSSESTKQLANIDRPAELPEDSVCSRVLQLLAVLADISQTWINKGEGALLSQDFVNRKLTAKMNRQLEEPLIVASSCLPNWTYWLMLKAPFLFPFETRYLFIQSTSFGYSRLIARWQSLQMRNNGQRDESQQQQQQPVLGRMERQKVRIMRAQMLESAIKILDLFGSSQSVLEIEYSGEEGTGLGPTLEFYAATSKEFCKKSINMWRDESSEGEYVSTLQGLFPKPLTGSQKAQKKVINLFKTLGQFMAKAMLDFRIIDIPFNPAFFKVALGREPPSDELIMDIDPVLGKSIQKLRAYIEKKQAINADKNLTPEARLEALSEIRVNDASIEDLCLDFTLPGEPDIVLKKGGDDIPVTIHNVEEYIELLEDMIAGSGIAKQMDAFRSGFNALFAIDDLKLLTYQELVSLFGVANEDWSYATLADAIKADHGFTMESASIKNLLSILSEMSEEERREFLQFTTGSPRLPIGGWKAMRPVFTVVCKTSEPPLQPDDYLPSVMTCANYLKMPDYSSKEVMLQRLLTSMKEGKNSFLLS